MVELKIVPYLWGSYFFAGQTILPMTNLWFILFDSTHEVWQRWNNRTQLKSKQIITDHIHSASQTDKFLLCHKCHEYISTIYFGHEKSFWKNCLIFWISQIYRKTVLYMYVKIFLFQLLIWWLQIEFTDYALINQYLW